MGLRIAVPVPSSDTEYNGRSLAPYLVALESLGATPLVLPAELSPAEVARVLQGTDAVLLPGSRFDIEPERYHAVRAAECGPADPARAALDELLLQDAFSLKKPVLGICAGCQSLNVWCGGTLVQDLRTDVNHRTGREVDEAHTITITAGSRLERIAAGRLSGWVNSTHHQAVERVGDRLKITALSAADRVVEAIELDSAEHFVLGVQWHPERTYATNALSQGIFKAFLDAARGSVHGKLEIGGSNGK